MCFSLNSIAVLLVTSKSRADDGFQETCIVVGFEGYKLDAWAFI
jgi:hypothetical protein